MSTERLVSRARAGDDQAFAMLFERYHDEVYRFAARRLGDPQAGQDVAAQTFADAFSAIGSFRWRGAPFEAWLYTIARRRIVDQFRANGRRPAEHAAADPISDPAGAVLDAVLVRALVRRLPRAERDVVELRFMEDLNVEQTARRLGKSKVAVRVAQHRALERLRGMLGEEMG